MAQKWWLFPTGRSRPAVRQPAPAGKPPAPKPPRPAKRPLGVEQLDPKVLPATLLWSAGTGAWSTGSNWTPAGPPTSADVAQINNGGTATVGSGTARANNFYLGANLGDAGGNLTVTGGAVTGADNIRHVYGNAAIAQSGGAVDSRWLFLAQGGGTGTYTLTGGTLDTGHTAIGGIGNGTFSLSGGTTHRITQYNPNEVQLFSVGGSNYTSGNGPGRGTYLLGNATSSGTLGAAAGSTVRMVIRFHAANAGTFEGWSPSAVNFTGTLTNNGVVRANGYGTDRTLDLSPFSGVLNAIENGTDEGNGWYATARGKLSLAAVIVASGTSTRNWGEPDADAVPDLVNSARLAFTNVAGGSLKVHLLAADRSEVPATRGPVLGVWQLDTSAGFSFGSGSATAAFRYDSALARAYGIDESALRVYKLSGGNWVDVTGSVDPASHLITTTAQTSGGVYAVGLGLTTAALPGGESHWTATSGNWSAAGNWAGGVPGASATGVINAGNAAVTSNQSAGNVTVGPQGHTAVTGGTLTVAGTTVVGQGAGAADLAVRGAGTLVTKTLQVGGAGGTGAFSLLHGGTLGTGAASGAAVLVGGTAAAAADGTFLFGNALGTGTVTDTASGGAALTVRANAGSGGTFRGWGTASFAGTLTNNGSVVADGYAYQRDLLLTAYSGLANAIDNAAAGTNGWYAVNRGRLVLKNVTAAAGTSAVNWGEDAADTSIDLVNSARLSFANVTGGAIGGALLASDRDEFNDVAGGVVGVWRFASAGFAFGSGSATLTFRYDHALAARLGLAEANFRVYQLVGSQWVDVTASIDATNKTITTSARTSLGTFAVGIGVAAGAGREEFSGPFASWLNVKDAAFGAVGDGVADDTAAIQQAINALFADDKRVVYVPAGTYRITGTLKLPPTDAATNPNKKVLLGKQIVGEDPEATRLVWDGAADGTMAHLAAVHTFTLSRLTLDGANKAGTLLRAEINTALTNYSSFVRLADLGFRNAKYGLYNTDLDNNNSGEAEYSVLRCRFDNISEVGIQIDSGNAYDYWVRYCQFTDCKYGVKNFRGDFKVMNSVFRNSGEADVVATGHRDGTVRDSYSVGSRRFLEINGGSMSVQNNWVVNTREVDAVRVRDAWDLLLLDNTFVTRPGVAQGPVVRELSTLGNALVAAGNTFTVTGNPFQLVTAGAIAFDNTAGAAGVSTAEPTLPGTPPKVTRAVFEVAPGTDTLQAKVDAAVTHALANPGSRPIVHLSTGNYFVTKTVVVPANVELSIVGDGLASKIGWSGAATAVNPTLLLRGPSRVTVRDLHFWNQNASAADFLVDNADQAGARVVGENINTQGAVWADRLVNARIDLTDFMSHRGVQVDGGATAGPSRVGVFAGAFSGSQWQSKVSNGGRLLFRDAWFEESAALSGPLFLATGAGPQAGELTVQGSFFYQNAGEGFAAVKADGFDGRLSVIGGGVIGSSTVAGNAANTKFLNLGGDVPLAAGSGTPGQSYSFDTGNPGTPDLNYLRSMLAFARSTGPDTLITAKPAGVTDVRLSRILNDYNTTYNLRVVPNLYNLANVAQGKATTASSNWSAAFNAEKATDGNAGTGWSPAAADAVPWVQVDLGTTHRLARVELVMRQELDQPATRQNFEVIASNDPTFASYAVLGSRGGTPLPHQATWTVSVSDPVTYRYVRARKTTSEYFFLAEVRVYGEPQAAAEVARGKAATASSSWSSGYGPANAVDGNTASGWSPSGADPVSWVQVDLGQAHNVTRVEVVTRQGVDQPETRRNFEVIASNDPTFGTYTVLGAQGSTSLAYQATWSADAAGAAFRYVRVRKTVAEYFFVADLRVFGTPTPAVASGASFVGADTTTRGNWKGNYGTQGYVLPGDASSLPADVTVAAAGKSDYTWASSTADARALQKSAAGSSDRLAACWYSGTSFTVDVAFPDAQAHEVSLYFLDWDVWQGGRDQKVEVLDEAGNVLDTRTLSDFSGGTWLTWAVVGRVKFRVTNLDGSPNNAVLSGVFFD